MCGRLAESPNNAIPRDQSVDSSSFNSIPLSLEIAGVYVVRQSAHADAIGVEARVSGASNYLPGQVKQLDFVQIQEGSAS